MEVPSSISEVLLSRLADRRMADVGEAYESTDVVRSDAPSRRLLFAGQADQMWLIAYEHGGRRRHDHLVLIGQNGDSFQIQLNARGDLRACREHNRRGCDLDGLKEAVRRGWFHPENVDSTYY